MPNAVTLSRHARRRCQLYGIRRDDIAHVVAAPEIKPHLHIDTTSDDQLVGIEVLQASHHLDLADVLRWKAAIDAVDAVTAA